MPDRDARVRARREWDAIDWYAWKPERSVTLTSFDAIMKQHHPLPPPVERIHTTAQRMLDVQRIAKTIAWLDERFERAHADLCSMTSDTYHWSPWRRMSAPSSMRLPTLARALFEVLP